MNVIDGPATQNFSNRPPNVPVDMIIVHSMAEQLIWGTSTCTAAEMLTLKNPPSTWTKPWSRVSAHYFITPTGHIHRIISPKLKAWHAGLSEWFGRTNLNNSTVGFEFLIPGAHDYESFLAAIETDIYTPEQYEAAGWLTARLMQGLDIPVESVRGHSEVSGPDVRPDPKQDPGDGFKWHLYYGWIAYYTIRAPTDDVT